MMISQIELSQKIMEVVQEADPEFQIEMRHYNAILNASTSIAEELRRKPRPAIDGMGLDAWLESDDTGSSSKFMAFVLSPEAPYSEYAHPYDPADFIRCKKLLQAVPELQGKLQDMSECSDAWSGLVDDWELISGLIEKDNGKEAYRLIQSHVRSEKENPA